VLCKASAARNSKNLAPLCLRGEYFHFVAIGSWDPTDDPARHIRWTKDFWNAMQPWSAHRVYANILNHDEDDRIPEAYGANYARLAEVKAEFDPLNVFRINHNIAPNLRRVAARPSAIDTSDRTPGTA
jgi:hypothetical protein